jgi:redox-sensitive bicupin YhaK (pirin superfamily)
LSIILQGLELKSDQTGGKHMITIRNANERGKADFGWLKSQHSFSFGNYYDPKQMGFGPLRVINQDRVSPGAGFDTHGHRDMEILSYVIEGALEHKDNTGTGSVILPGDIQRMSAGSGILHSEFNHSKREPVHFLQIWIAPSEKGIDPGYEQKHFGKQDLSKQFTLIAGPQGGKNAVKIHQDASLFLGVLEAAQTRTLTIAPNRGIWVQVVKGSISINEESLKAGDGAAIEQESKVTITAFDKAEFLLFDLAL